MGIRFTTRQCGDDYYFVDQLQKMIADYDLSGLTNDNISNVPNIELKNPLAVLFSSELNDQGADTSILPMIGIEMNPEKETERNILGQGHKIIEITQTLMTAIKAISLRDRFAIGLFISDNQITEIEAILTDYEGTQKKLFAETNQRLIDCDLSISIWTTNKQHARLLKDIVRSCIQFSKKDLSKRGVKNLTYNTSGSLYNYDFDKTLYGEEIKISYLNFTTDYFVDDTIPTINKIEGEAIFQEKEIITEEVTDEFSRLFSIGTSENPPVGG